ncbi:hypothetical protein LPJ56_003673 [Coemansia sp. RSA 2599]|nr:hypothetical protein LPJ75_003432 [Coemansia sp. RSA 2598]KAJ1819323.1 hypothetical protein LPJ56_003673 [Coemansia sp. RSA 2599]
MDNTITAPGRASCVTGYNLVVGVAQQNIASGALYSFSVSDSADGLCGTGATVLSYYTVLRNYIPWIASVVGESSIGAMPVTDPGYALTNVPATYAAVPASPAGGGMVAGDGFNLNSGTGEAVNQGVTPKAGQESPAVNEPEVQVVSSTVTISITEQVTEFEMISAQTTNTISTTTTETDTTTATTVTTSTETATSTSVVQETVTVTQTQNANGQQASGNGGSNNIAINLDNGQANNNGGVAQTITVTTTATATLSGFTTVTETGVTTVTASVFMSASVAADGATTVVVAVSTMDPPSADTVTVTTVSTELITSVYTVTAVPTGGNGEALAGTVVSTVTETVTANTSGTITEYVGGSASESDPKKSDKQSSSIANATASEDSDTTVDDSDSGSKLSSGAIAGIVIAILLLLVLIGYFIWRRRSKKANEAGVTRVKEWMFNHNNKRYSDAPTYTV